jgi:hypothetical protein
MTRLGLSIVKTQPTPGRSCTFKNPSWASMARLQIDSHNPTPDRSTPPCVKGINIVSTNPAGSPPQQSWTSMRTRSSCAYARNVTSECGCVNLNAFCNRLPTAEASRSRSLCTPNDRSTAATVSVQPRPSASSEAPIWISARKSATRMRGVWYHTSRVRSVTSTELLDPTAERRIERRQSINPR